MTARVGTRASCDCPDFVIGGAPRCGTTWLYRALDLHPSILMAKPPQPEPKFFLIDEEYGRGLAYYRERWFPSIPSAVIAGEKSTNYLESALAAERMAHDLPSARVIFLLREPAARALSNYQWTRMHGLEALDFFDAVMQETDRETAYAGHDRYSRPFSYFSRGLYARLLHPWLEEFPRDQVLLLRFEDIIDDPAKLLSGVHRFLGVEERTELAEEVGVVNDAPSVDVDPYVMSALRDRYSEPNDRLYKLLGRRLWSTS
jgi:Sulfotransferase domain